MAALRTIGSQTHPAIQQMLLAHEQQLGELQLAVRQGGGVLAGDVLQRLNRLEGESKHLGEEGETGRGGGELSEDLSQLEDDSSLPSFGVILGFRP